MAERSICIHGHFYQPPRENPGLEAVEIQDSAFPYHDWNERVTAECYAPNTAARTVDTEQRITGLINNYSKISFNFGPTLLSWMERRTPGAYEAILEADRMSVASRSGHGNAIAQIYNHVIMPLANRRDKETQVMWGIRDFEHRFGRSPEGMWLPETAVDLETLEICAKCGISFVILAPHQAARIKSLTSRTWHDLKGSGIDPTRAYLCRLPSGLSINLFFYDGPISRAVAFENLLGNGESLVNRLLGGFSDRRGWPQLLHIATDGETYGHHFKFGDMALAYALTLIESQGLARLTNYGEYLERSRPHREVEIIENTSWSCSHGIERWREACGCNSGGHAGWSQEWRAPLRHAFDWLRDRLIEQFEREAPQYLKDPWEARNGYIDVVLHRTPGSLDAFFQKHGARQLADPEKIAVRTLLEIQRHAMLMYTSCGWFFDELSGPETVQVLQYAGRAIQLSGDLARDNNIESEFLRRVERAKSNIPDHGDGARVYEKFVRPAAVDLKKVAVHYAVSSLYKEYEHRAQVFDFTVSKEDYTFLKGGTTRFAAGKVSVESKATGNRGLISFAVISLGGANLSGGVREYGGDESYFSMKGEATRSFQEGSVAEVIRIIDRDFGRRSYSLRDLFRDEQRRIARLIMSDESESMTALFHQMYEQSKGLMNFLKEIGVPLPNEFLAAATAALNHYLVEALAEEGASPEKVRALVDEAGGWGIPLDTVDLEFRARRLLEAIADEWKTKPQDLSRLYAVKGAIDLSRALPVDVNYWHVQNIYCHIPKAVYNERSAEAGKGDEEAREWTRLFEEVGAMLHTHVSRLLGSGEGGERWKE